MHSNIFRRSCIAIILLGSKLLPIDRPKYRKAGSAKYETGRNKDEHNVTAASAEKQHQGQRKHRRVLHRSKTFMETIQRLRPIQVHEHLVVFNDLYDYISALTAKINHSLDD